MLLLSFSSLPWLPNSELGEMRFSADISSLSVKLKKLLNDDIISSSLSALTKFPKGLCAKWRINILRSAAVSYIFNIMQVD